MPAQPAGSRSEVVFIDQVVADYEVLVAGVRPGARADECRRPASRVGLKTGRSATAEVRLRHVAGSRSDSACPPLTGSLVLEGAGGPEIGGAPRGRFRSRVPASTGVLNILLQTAAGSALLAPVKSKECQIGRAMAFGRPCLLPSEIFPFMPPLFHMPSPSLYCVGLSALRRVLGVCGLILALAAVSARGEAGPVAREVVFIDTAVSDYAVLANAVRPGMETVLLDPAGDELLQMARWAETHAGYAAIHLISHGSAGTLRLGTNVVRAAIALDGATIL